MKIRIAIGSDHAGFDLKNNIFDAISSNISYEVTDMGTHTPDSVDYPDFGAIVGRAVAAGEFDLGILVCGTGVGITISANKIKGVRAACVSEPYSARMSRAHNTANIVGFGSRVVGLGLALEIVEAFLQTPFQAGTRHETRVDKINALDCAREEV